MPDKRRNYRKASRPRLVSIDRGTVYHMEAFGPLPVIARPLRMRLIRGAQRKRGVTIQNLPEGGYGVDLAGDAVISGTGTATNG